MLDVLFLFFKGVMIRSWLSMKFSSITTFRRSFLLEFLATSLRLVGKLTLNFESFLLLNVIISLLEVTRAVALPIVS